MCSWIQKFCNRLKFLFATQSLVNTKECPWVSKKVIKNLVSITAPQQRIFAPQLLGWLILNTSIKFKKDYNMSVIKEEHDELSIVLSRRLMDWAQTFRIFFLLIETYIKLSFLQSNRLGYQSVCLCVSCFPPNSSKTAKSTELKFSERKGFTISINQLWFILPNQTNRLLRIL